MPQIQSSKDRLAGREAAVVMPSFQELQAGRSKLRRLCCVLGHFFRCPPGIPAGIPALRPSVSALVANSTVALVTVYYLDA